MQQAISLAILSREPALLHGLTTCFKDAPDVDVVWSGPPRNEILDAVMGRSPAVALVDCAPNDTVAWEIAESLTSDPVSLQVVIYSNSQLECSIRRALDLSAAAYVLRSDPIESIVHSVRGAAEGRSYFSTLVRQRLEYDMSANTYVLPMDRGLSSLTRQQLRVMEQLARGDSVRVVAETLRLSPKTVDNHKTRIMQKLGVHDRVHLSRIAIREGLIQA